MLKDVWGLVTRESSKRRSYLEKRAAKGHVISRKKKTWPKQVKTAVSEVGAV
jgi:hypothetical protein